MAPNFSGDVDIDHMEISVLNAITLKLCGFALRPGGTMLMKTLHGTLENEFFVSISILIYLLELLSAIL